MLARGRGEIGVSLLSLNRSIEVLRPPFRAEAGCSAAPPRIAIGELQLALSGATGIRGNGPDNDQSRVCWLLSGE